MHVVEDDASVRKALARVLDCAGFETRGYASAAEFLVADRKNEPACLVLDVGLPGLSGVELQAALVKRGSAPPIVFITGESDIPTSVRAMKAGAVDFLTKPVSRQALLGAVGEALRRSERERNQREDLHAVRARYDTLTAREREVYAGVIGGKLNKQIAAELGTSIRTVKAHRARVMTKMQVTSLAALVGTAVGLGHSVN